MQLNYKIILALGMLWIVVPAEAQTADSPSSPEYIKVGPPPKRDGQPVRVESDKDETLNKGKVVWSPRNTEMGTFAQGQLQVREMKFTNTSNEPLQILKIKSSCHCTTAEWPEVPIAPGESGIILIKHNAEEKGAFLRILSVQTSFDPNNWLLVSVTGTVE